MELEELKLITEAISKVSGDAAPLLGMYIGQGYFSTFCSTVGAGIIGYAFYKVCYLVLGSFKREKDADRLLDAIENVAMTYGIPSSEAVSKAVSMVDAHYKALDDVMQAERNTRYGTK